VANRIYALAKQLKMDSKDLVLVCERAGIKGKSSALSQLTDEEEATLFKFLEAQKTRSSTRPAESGPAPAIRREDYIPPAGTVGKPPVLTGRPSERPPLLRSRKTEPSPAPAPAPPKSSVIAPPVAAPETPAVESPVESPVAAAASESGAGILPAESPPLPGLRESVASIALPEAPASAEPAAVVGPVAESGTPAVESAAGTAEPPKPESRETPRELPSAPMPTFERPKVSPFDRPIRELSARERAQRKADREKQKEKTGPAIRLAAVPTAAKPPRKPAVSEPAPQKPDIKLPLDAIRAGRGGAKPLSEQLRKREEKRAADSKSERDEEPAKGRPLNIDAATLEGLLQAARDRVKKQKGIEGEEEEAVTLGGREQRQLKRKKTAAAKRVVAPEEEEDAPAVHRPKFIRRTGGASTAAPRKGKLVVELPCTVRSFCEACGIPVKSALTKLLQLGQMTNVAANLDPDLAELLAAELGLDVELRRPVPVEDAVIAALESMEDPPESLQPRPPVITFLGHVDHGKTSLLDRILDLHVAAGEKGGITQHIRAYQIEKQGRPISFVDTPGHEAFTEMRARGANVTDIAVLVVAADDGVMPQTEEAISHARAAGVPIVVALNKIDLPSANPDRVYQQLAAAELLPTDWGGDVEVVKTSAATGAGIDELLETLLTVAELHDLRANPNRPALGVCLETSLSEGRGVEAKLLVQKGTLKVGDVIVCGAAYGRVKALYDTLHTRKRLTSAGPSTPVTVTGLDQPPNAGDRFYVLADIAQARQVAEAHQAKARATELSGTRAHVTLENLFERLGQMDKVQTLNIIIRADVRGSIEAIRKELSKLEHPEVQIKVLQAAVGGITEADVHLADASDAIIVGFNVAPDEGARLLAEQRRVQIRRYDIIYQLTQDLKDALEGMLRPEKQEKDLGRALVQRVFRISRVGAVAGCRVLAGTITRDARMRIIRDSRVVGDYAIETLKREKDDVREVREGMECGIKLAGFDDVKEGDLLEAYKIEEIARTL